MLTTTDARGSVRTTASRSCAHTFLIALVAAVLSASTVSPSVAAAPPAQRTSVVPHTDDRVQAACDARVQQWIQDVHGWQIDAPRSRKERREQRAEQALLLAVLDGDAARTRTLLRAFMPDSQRPNGAGASPHQRKHALQLSLNLAALADKPALIQLLVRHGADPDYTTEQLGVPAVTVAAQCDNIAAMQALDAAGASLSTPINRNDEARTAPRTALEVAVYAGRSEAVIWLVVMAARCVESPSPGG